MPFFDRLFPEQSPEDVPLPKLVSTYGKLREKRAAIDERLKAVKAAMAELEAVILHRMQKDGIDRLTVDGYTAAPRINTVVRVVDWESLQRFVIEHEAWDFFRRGVTKQPALEWYERTGDPPPGTEVDRIINLSYQKATR
ncbi:MAG TPA: hypothetical protein ENI87_05400 [bacterium]|nr:hypothetical protein [bacterium]